MNGRKLFREYAQYRNQEAKEFVRIEKVHEYYGDYDEDVLITKSNSGKEERTTIDYKDMVHWIIKTKKND